MHFFALIIGLAIGCIIHCLRSGRNPYWILPILVFPLVGSLAYLLVEVAPGLGQRRAVRMAKQAAVETIDPDRDVRAAREALATTDTAANRIWLADALADQANWSEAAIHYLLALEKAPLGDRATQLKLARACLEMGNATEARRLVETLPETGSAAERDRAGLLLARALAELGETDAAIALFAEIGERMPGAEAQCRQAGLLLEQGRDDEAVAPLEEVARRVKRLDRFELKREREMYDWAERTLAELRARGL